MARERKKERERETERERESQENLFYQCEMMMMINDNSIFIVNSYKLLGSQKSSPRGFMLLDLFIGFSFHECIYLPDVV